MTGDGRVDLADRDRWLAEAGEINLGPGKTYLLGDATLDGIVDGQDFIAWNANKFNAVTKWSSGDFNADGMVDGQDFIEWNYYKYEHSDAAYPLAPWQPGRDADYADDAPRRVRHRLPWIVPWQFGQDGFCQSVHREATSGLPDVNSWHRQR